MSAQDLELNSGVRTVLNRHWIDLTKTSFFARKGHVHLGGEARVLGEARGTTAEALKSTEAELRRLPDVKTVSFGFTNWVRDASGAWICLDKGGEERGSGPTTGGSSGNSVVELDWLGNEVRSAARGGTS